MNVKLRRLNPGLVALAGATIAVASVAWSHQVEKRLAQSDHSILPGSRPFDFRNFDPLQRLELNTYDWRARMARARETNLTPNLGFVAVDDVSIEELQNGNALGIPVGLLWPRYIYGLVLRELRARGVQGVAMDIQLGDERRDHNGVPLPGLTNISSDHFFAVELAASGNVVLGSAPNFPPTFQFRQAAWRLGGVEVPRDVDGTVRRVRAFVDYRFYDPQIESQARRQEMKVIGTNAEAVVLAKANSDQPVLWPIRADGSVEILLRSGSKVTVPAAQTTQRVWHMGIALAALRLGLDLDAARVEPGRILFPDTDGIVIRVLPVTQGNLFPINWSTTTADWNKDHTNRAKVHAQGLSELIHEGRERQLSSTNLGENYWSNSLVVIGSTATGNNLADQGATAIAALDYLTSTYINVADSMLRGQFVHFPPVWVSYLIALVAALLGSGLTWRLRTGLATFAVLLVAAGWVFISVWVFQRDRLWLPVANPLVLGLFLNTATMLTYRSVFEQSERQRVRSIFAKIVSPNVVQELLKAEKISVRGARRQLTVFFADVRGFTEMTDRAQAAAEEHVQKTGLTGAAAEAYFEQQSAEVLATVNLYLATIADVIKQHRGTLDKYIGDCVMAFWGAPTPNPRHAVDAVCAAVEAQQAIQRVNTEREAENQKRDAEAPQRAAQGLPALSQLAQLSLGTGINTGFMTVGLMGSDSHILNYTVFGREVNLASRLEGVSGRGRIIIGEATYRELTQHLPDLAARCLALEPVTVKGFRQAVPVYEVLWRDSATLAATAAAPVPPPEEMSEN